MRLPRIRFTIGRLMIVILVTGMLTWALLVIGPNLIHQHIIVKKAEAAYEQASWHRDSNEHSLNEFEAGRAQFKIGPSGEISLSGEDNRRAMKASWSIVMSGPGVVQSPESMIEHLRSEIEKAKVDELAKLDSFRKERAKFWWSLLGF